MEGIRISSYKDLIVWQKAMDLVVEIYKITEDFPKSELYGLTSQIRRAAISIPSNIAEGKTRNTKKDYRHFVIIAFASGAELETQIELAKRIYKNLDTNYLKADSLLIEVMKMLNALKYKLNP
ncbi:MAG: four helix bundle protein [Candidatus Magasanikbacteria bacterium CG_4_10_14_0_2_um_filter_37_12]|uniref:Four helix bundle protein n=1 Tax=Candidatus Magasanikbacteria bacterium CG_4_10_14_0_2_um_filter_37_12 TaxID=1974637 RepID=A0A2M7V9U2_9BACT|nr:MAG: four helix bundle protein [Candidatus Magasanikbacteria bacterium CG_4_10_14_0_2_um_filter_37_12]